jgi:hypothetical protein
MDPQLRKELAEFWREYDRRSLALRKVLLCLAYRRLASLPATWLDCWIAEKHQVDLAETQDFSAWPPRLETVDDRIAYCLEDCARALNRMTLDELVEIIDFDVLVNMACPRLHDSSNPHDRCRYLSREFCQGHEAP